MDVIASRKNPFVATVRRVADGEDRDRVLLDGLHLLEEARAAQIPITSAAFTATRARRRRRASPPARHRARRHRRAGRPGRRSGDGRAQPDDASVRRRRRRGAPEARARRRGRPAAAARRPLVVVAVDVQDPGNVGAIARVAEAAGATGLRRRRHSRRIRSAGRRCAVRWAACSACRRSTTATPPPSPACCARTGCSAWPPRRPAPSRSRRIDWRGPIAVLRRQRGRRPARGAAGDGRSPRPHPDGGAGRIAQRRGVGRPAALRSARRAAVAAPAAARLVGVRRPTTSG